MATEVGSIVYRVDLDKKGFESGVNSVNNSLKSMDSSAGASTLSLGKLTGAFALGQLAADGIKSAISSVSGIFRSAFTDLAGIQNTKSSFEVLTGSVEKADKVYRDLAEYAKATPFETGDLAAATKTLLGYGSTSEGVGKQIRQIGDIAGATGGDISQLSLVFGQIQAKGKLTGEEFRQLNQSGAAFGDVIAKELNIQIGRAHV